MIIIRFNKGHEAALDLGHSSLRSLDVPKDLANPSNFLILVGMYGKLLV